MHAIFSNKNIRNLILSNTVTRFGDSIETIAFSWVVYQLTGSLSIMGLVFALNFIPNILFAPFAGVYADRHNRKSIVILSDLLRGLNATLIAFFLFQHTATVWMIVFSSFINSTLESFASPARRALFADLIPRDQFLKVASVSSSLSSSAELLGLGTAGIIVAFGGNGMAFLVDAFTFFFSAWGITQIAYHKAIPAESKANSYWNDIKKGILLLGEYKIIPICIAASAMLNFFFTPLNVLLPKYADDVLHMGVKGVSLIEVSMTIGMICGGLLIASIHQKFKLSTISITGFMLLGVTYLLLGLVPRLPIASFIAEFSVAVAFLFGMAVPTISTPLQTTVMRIIPENKRGIISSVMGTFILIAIPLGGALIGMIGDHLNVTQYFLVASLGILILSGFLFKNQTYREI